MKKIIGIILLLCTLTSFPAVYASGIPDSRLLPRVVDRADLLTDGEESALTYMYDKMSERLGCDIAVVTVNSLSGKSAQAYADDFYDYNGYGMGDGDHGILLLISMKEREWAFSTYGLAIRAIPNYALESIADEIVPDLSAGDYYTAFATYASLAENYIEYYRENGSVSDYYGSAELTLGEKIGISLAVGAIISLIIMLAMKSGMKTIRKNNYATPYIVDGSMSITESRDLYLYRNVTRTRRETQSSGGGTHRSSSGRSHGGARGRF